MSNARYRLFPLLALLLVTGAAEADVYKRVYPDGHVEYTDKPDSSGFKLIIKTPPAFSKPIKVSFGGKGSAASADRGFAARAFPPSRPAFNPELERNRQQYASLVEEAAARHNVPPGLLDAVIRAESSYNPEAVSHKGAMGLMQLMPGTASRYGVRDPYNPVQNIHGGARYLSDLLDMFRSDVRLAVAAYNAGENNVIKYGNRVPPFAETQNYVTKVLGFYNRRYN
jgi:soluble lytic murein transglycosylase-like protein